MRQTDRNGGRGNRGDIIEKEWLLVCAYRISWHGHLYICRRATRGRSAVGDMFAGHDLLPTSATVNLRVTTSASATETQRGNRTPRHVHIFSNILKAIPSSSFFPRVPSAKLSRLHSFQLDPDEQNFSNFNQRLSTLRMVDVSSASEANKVALIVGWLCGSLRGWILIELGGDPEDFRGGADSELTRRLPATLHFR